MDNYMIAGIVLFAVFAALSVWIATRKVYAGPACPACKTPTSWRTCSADVSPECYTAALCGDCGRVGGDR